MDFAQMGGSSVGTFWSGAGGGKEGQSSPASENQLCFRLESFLEGVLEQPKAGGRDEKRHLLKTGRGWDGGRGMARGFLSSASQIIHRGINYRTI